MCAKIKFVKSKYNLYVLGLHSSLACDRYLIQIPQHRFFSLGCQDKLSVNLQKHYNQLIIYHIFSHIMKPKPE